VLVRGITAGYKTMVQIQHDQDLTINEKLAIKRLGKCGPGHMASLSRFISICMVRICLIRLTIVQIWPDRLEDMDLHS